MILEQAPGTQPTVAVVGAGLTGLTAAYRLQQAGWRVEVFEPTGLAGGRVQTVVRDGYRMDTGASGLAGSYHAYFRLIDELGLRSEIEPTAPGIGTLRAGRIHMIRTDQLLRSGLAMRLLSMGSKLKLMRLAFDIVRARLRGQLDYADMRRAAPLDDQTASAYAQRYLNTEIDDYLCNPVARMMLIADSNQISRVELFSGLANVMSTRIYALRGGQARLPEVLAEKVKPQLHCKVTRVAEREGGIELQYEDAAGTLQQGTFDACVVACPLPAATSMCVDRQSLLAPMQRALRYTQAITVAVATRRPPNCPAFVVQLPHCESPDLALIFLEHNKCSDRAPAGKGLLGVDWSAQASAQWFDADDAAIAEHTIRGVVAIFPELKDQIEFTHVTRWPQALPWTQVGAYRLIGEFNAALDPKSRLQFAGDYMSAAGQNTAVEFGERAANRLIEHCGQRPVAPVGLEGKRKLPDTIPV